MQVIFIDTPGIHKSTTKLGVELNKMAFSSTRDVELTLLIVDASKRSDELDDSVL
jgi:GTP-binding protein Era